MKIREYVPAEKVVDSITVKFACSCGQEILQCISYIQEHFRCPVCHKWYAFKFSFDAEKEEAE